MPTTSNFGWTTPADTDLVKDGAAAIRTLGNGIDTSFIDLKGGTTGQVLSKASNTDLDYSWVTPNVGDITEVQAGTGISVASGTGPIPVVTNTVATTFDAKGDLVVGTGADTFAKLTVGTNGHTLVADSSTSTGLKWAAASTGAVKQIVYAQLSTTATTTSTSATDLGLSASITPSSVSSDILVQVMLPISLNGSNCGGYISLYDGSNNNLINPTSPGTRVAGFYRSESDRNMQTGLQSAVLLFKHSPATTSSFTYKIRWYVVGAGATYAVNRFASSDTDDPAFMRSVATMTLMEI